MGGAVEKGIPVGIPQRILPGMATTIKVSEEFRDQVNSDARKRGVTAAGFLEQLVVDFHRRERMEAFGRAFASADETYWDEFHRWDAALADGDTGE